LTENVFTTGQKLNSYCHVQRRWNAVFSKTSPWLCGNFSGTTAGLVAY